MSGHVETGEQRGRQLERVLHLPVLIAAGVSVPAVFLSPLDGPAGTIGTLANWLSMVVLTTETSLLFLVSKNRVRWLREHWWVVFVTLAAVPAVLFAVGPAQVLRLARAATAVQVLKVGRLLKALRIVRRRGTRFGRLRDVLTGGIAMLAVGFLLAVLGNPRSTVRRALDTALQLWGWGPLLGLCVLVLITTTVVSGLWTRWLHGHDQGKSDA